MGKTVVKAQMDAGHKSPRDPTNMCRGSEDGEDLRAPTRHSRGRGSS